MTEVLTQGPEVRPEPAPHGGPSRYGLRHALGMEWIKLRSVRSTGWSLAITVVLTIAIGVLATTVQANRWQHEGIVDRIRFDPVRLSLTGILFAQLALGVLGILVMTAEYGTGTIRSTLAAVPSRVLVLVSKVIVFAVVAVVTAEAVSFVAFFIGQSILSGSTPHAVLSQPGVLRSVVGSGLYLTVLSLLGLGLATIIRHTAAAISTFVGVLLILPLIVSALPQSIVNAVGKYLPANIGVAMISVRPRPQDHLFSPWVGFGLLCLYAAVALVVGAIVLERKDA